MKKHMLSGLRDIRSRIEVGCRNLALDMRLQRGGSDYTKFVIVSRARSGTNFLRGLLNTHSQVIAFGELFAQADAIGWQIAGYGQTAKQLALFQRDPVGFLQAYVYRKYPRRIAAVGFKIFYYHPANDGWKPVWQYFRDQDDLRVIHVKRRNILATHLSLRRARQTGQWENRSHAREECPKVMLSYEECLDVFQKTRHWEQTTDAMFDPAKKIEVAYEDLSADYMGEMARIQRFLGVDDEAVQPSHFKQNTQPLSDAIENYIDLKARFAGTPWQVFFEE